MYFEQLEEYLLGLPRCRSTCVGKKTVEIHTTVSQTENMSLSKQIITYTVHIQTVPCTVPTMYHYQKTTQSCFSTAWSNGCDLYNSSHGCDLYRVAQKSRCALWPTVARNVSIGALLFFNGYRCNNT